MNIKQCPNDQEALQSVLFHAIEADYCPRCLGIWFDKDELRMAKDDADQSINWMDVDLWRDKGRFRITRKDKHCPVDRSGLVEVGYDDSKAKIDFCKMCEGVWLDRGEFKQLVNYLKTKSDYEILNHYAKNLAKQTWEIFSGPGTFRDELEDFLMVVKLMNYKFVVQYPMLEKLIENAQK